MVRTSGIRSAALHEEWAQFHAGLQFNPNCATAICGKLSDADVARVGANQIRVVEEMKIFVNKINGKETMPNGDYHLCEVLTQQSGSDGKETVCCGDHHLDEALSICSEAGRRMSSKLELSQRKEKTGMGMLLLGKRRQVGLAAGDCAGEIEKVGMLLRKRPQSGLLQSEIAAEWRRKLGRQSTLAETADEGAAEVVLFSVGLDEAPLPLLLGSSSGGRDMLLLGGGNDRRSWPLFFNGGLERAMVVENAVRWKRGIR
ncbi:unnamed protein product [Linum tenue]|uniref:Uncharacterized protein n=1 Tax=Linum tenue TaxID=586396 RepID=A0AAV0HBG7_9ROSI|nr:unnamed protein product [Linum tenue]CAI0382636.1 unnamed protein product [Linum tenue]